uniref:Uncharacterized protein n=1 Tax=Arundo donax TaxID=35708 RepID=A0A0A9AWR0_ARUDO
MLLYSELFEGSKVLRAIPLATELYISQGNQRFLL